MTSVRSFALGLGALALVLLGPPTLPPAGASATNEPVLVIDGKGNGHGVGLSQDGALAMGEDGAGTDEILAKFYPGTYTAAGGGVLGVRVLETAGTRVDVAFPGGGKIRAVAEGPQPAGFPMTVAPGGTATISLQDGAFRAESDDGQVPEIALPSVGLIAAQPAPAPAPTPTEAPTTTSTTIGESATTTTPPSTEATTTTTTPTEDTLPPITSPGTEPPAPVDAEPPPTVSTDGLRLVPDEGSTTALGDGGRHYRGTVEVGGSVLGGLLLVNRIDVEDYLKGMGEVLDPSWPAAALRAQAIAARTYALRATRTGGTLCDDDRCQVYLGAAVEYAEMNLAVDESAGQVLAFEGALASTVYSASGGGVTATPREGFGPDGSDYPYLPATPYTVADPPVWSASVALSDLGRRLGYPGRLRTVTVSSAGPSGRVLEVALDGDAGRRVVAGLRFASRLNLDSTLFSLRTMTGTWSPPLPPSQGSIQAPPDAAASLPPMFEPASLTAGKGGGFDVAHALRSVLTLVAAALLYIQSRRRRATLRVP